MTRAPPPPPPPPKPPATGRAGLPPPASADQRDDRLQMAMEALVQLFPNCAVALLVAPFGGPPGQRVNYVANGQRDDMKAMMKEVIARWEGRHQNAPEGKQ